jgi:hypothetical protein
MLVLSWGFARRIDSRNTYTNVVVLIKERSGGHIPLHTNIVHCTHLQRSKLAGARQVQWPDQCNGLIINVHKHGCY